MFNDNWLIKFIWRNNIMIWKGTSNCTCLLLIFSSLMRLFRALESNNTSVPISFPIQNIFFRKNLVGEWCFWLDIFHTVWSKGWPYYITLIFKFLNKSESPRKNKSCSNSSGNWAFLKPESALHEHNGFLKRLAEQFEALCTSSLL